MASFGKEIFVSYGREPEVSAFVKKLKSDLEALGFSVWLDTDDIPAGSDWHGAIGTGLQQSKALIAVITNKYITSKFCTNELYTANSDQKHIFPIILENIDFNSSERARGVKYVIGAINWTMFRHGYDDYQMSVDRLVQGMRECGLGGVSGDQIDGTVTSEMAKLHVSSPKPTIPPSPTAPPPSSHLVNYPSPSPYYTPGPYGGPGPSPHMMSSPHTPYYPYSPPQVYPAYMPQPGYPYPYLSPHASPTHPTSHPYYPPPAPPSGTTMGPGDAPPPYSAVSPSSGQNTLIANLPSSASQDRPPSPHPSPSQTTPTRPSPQEHHSTDSTSPSHGDTSKGKSSTFEVGMKLEATDRRFPYFVCVATIMDRKDSEVLIHFDGWGPEYDYWCSSCSPELHPQGWCQSHNWELQTPLNQSWTSWKQYLDETDSPAAPEALFSEDQLAGPGSLLFQPDMKVEAKDRQNPNLICVATIANIKDGKLLIHFDGWTSRYDYWCRPESTDIHPPHWSGKNNRELHPPYGHFGRFKWSEYLRQPGPVPAPAYLFTEEQRSVPSAPSPQNPRATKQELKGFKVGMRLEAKDRKYPTLTCVATVSSVRDKKLLIHFDGWGNEYDYLCEVDSTDIHPVGWAARHGHELQKPKGHSGDFKWKKYLSKNGFVAAPSHLFSPAQTN